MSKEEFLKIQTCVLKVNIHCDGCKQKVKKILQKIDGVYTINIDSEQGKVTVSGDVDPDILIKKLTKNGKHAELWGASNANNNLQNQLNDQLKALQIEQAKCRNTKGQNQKGGNNQLKGGPPVGQLQQLRQMKGFQDLKMPPQFMKDLKMPLNKEQNQKSVRFNLPEDEDLSDDDDEDEEDDEELDGDGIEDAPLNKMKPMIGNGQGGPQIPKMLMSNMTGGNIGGNGGGIAKGGGGVGNIPVQMNVGSGGRNGGNKGNNGNNHVNNQNQGGGKGGKNGGGQPQGSKNGGAGGSVVVGGGGQSMISGAGSGGSGGGVANGNNITENVAKKGVGMPNMMGMNPSGSLPTGQINNLAAVQSLPTSAMNTSGGGGYFQGGPLPEHLARNPYYQQQLAAMMMNQQQANGNERFQPMMYTRPPPAVNYMPPPYPPYPYPYAPPHAPGDDYAMYNDENTSSCSVM
ncbi:heavy metal-associated isoprenylated plant protein 32-like [Primulina huaijiensis]|uniref:heavy metal-associated isoprenylated plant protein 32-like n=1 Tax=Primulina huaijiensis TaxID=1492673 RepID=UPI003CC7815F